MIVNFLCFWIFFIPVGYTLAFKYDLMLMGFWIGLILAAILLSLIMGITLYKNIKVMEKTLDFVSIDEI
ncbi:hypothetical protein IJZ97_02705, partial [bacterium]|nr:hypothetical protein [bacterium]